MPELPEIEILVRHLDPLLRGRRIGGVRVLRERIVRPHTSPEFAAALEGAVVTAVRRRAKFLVFELRPGGEGRPGRLIGHLGMTGRMFVQDSAGPLPRHTAVTLGLGGERWVFEDTRYFGRMTFDESCLEGLGPEPLEAGFTTEGLGQALGKSRQPIKVRLLDPRVVVGVGNIYASESLHRAGISPKRMACRLSVAERGRLVSAIREVLSEAIRFGSTLPLDFGGMGSRDGLFYYGEAAWADAGFEERLRVYDRAGQPCHGCGGEIRRIVQAARSTYFCSICQR